MILTLTVHFVYKSYRPIYQIHLHLQRRSLCQEQLLILTLLNLLVSQDLAERLRSILG